MKKPKWKDAPKRAKWLAQDFNGSWHWYVIKPRSNRSVWVPSGDMYYAMTTIPNVDWEDTLEKRP